MPKVVLGPAADLPAGAMRGYRAGEHHFLVAHVGDQFYALDAKCPHMGADLTRGKLQGYVVTCPLHGSRFDVRDGHVVAWVDKMPGLVKGALTAIKGPTAATSYRVQVEEGNLVILLPDAGRGAG